MRGERERYKYRGRDGRVRVDLFLCADGVALCRERCRERIRGRKRFLLYNKCRCNYSSRSQRRRWLL